MSGDAGLWSSEPVRAAAPRGCLPTLAVFLLMIGIVGGGFVAAEAVEDVPTPPVEVGQGVVIRPLEGWEFGGRADDGNGVLFSRGDGTMAVQLLSHSLTPALAAEGLIAEWTADPDVHITRGAVEAVEVRPGLVGSRFHYAGTFAGIAAPVEGEVTVLPGSSATVLVDAWSGDGGYQFIRAQIDQMLSEATL